MNLTPPVAIRRPARFGIVTLVILVSSLLGPMSSSSAGDGPSDSCSTIVGVISRAGLNVEISAPAFGCRQAANGDWYIPPIAVTNDSAVIDQLTPFGKTLLEAVDRMSTDRAFSSSVQFDRERSIAYVVGAGGEMDPIDISNEPIAFGVAPNSRLRDGYSESVMLYLTRTLGTEADLVHYMDWFMARRDLTLMTLANNFNPMAAMGFTDKWGYQQFPWPWQLADPAAIAAFTGQEPLDFSPDDASLQNAVKTPTAPPASTDTSPPPEVAYTGPVFTPTQLTVVPGEVVDIAVSLPTTTFSGGFVLTVTLPGGVELLRVPQCTPVAACEGAAIDSEVTQDQGDSTDVRISGLLIDRDNPASFSLTLKMPEQAPNGGSIFVHAGVDFMSHSAPSNVPRGSGLAIVFESPAAFNQANDQQGEDFSSSRDPGDESPSIQVTKKRCEGRDIFPVFVESHCVDVPGASFSLKDPSGIHTEALSSGELYVPDERYFAGSSLWRLEDNSLDTAMRGVRVVSCLESEPGSNWHSSVLSVVHPDIPRSVLLQWMFVPTGVPGDVYQPSLDCIWFELPDIYAVPAVLSLQVFTSATPYLNWTEPTGPKLQDVARGKSGENLEAAMVMTNIDSGEVYSFSADAYGQVLVPSGTYSLVEKANGLEKYFTMRTGQTTLAEVGLAAPTPLQSAPTSRVETQTFGTGALNCDAAGCSSLVGVTIHYESLDASIQGYCVTESVETPNGIGAWCNYEYIPGVPTVLTLDESTLPAGWVLTSENPQTYLVPEHPDGELSPVYFQVGPAQ